MRLVSEALGNLVIVVHHVGSRIRPDRSDVPVILFHRSSESALWGGSGYRKNRSDAPSVRARLFFQNDRVCPPPTAAGPVVGVK